MSDREAIWLCDNTACGKQVILPWPGPTPPECPLCKGVVWTKVLDRKKENEDG